MFCVRDGVEMKQTLPGRLIRRGEPVGFVCPRCDQVQVLRDKTEMLLFDRTETAKEAMPEIWNPNIFDGEETANVEIERANAIRRPGTRDSSPFPG